MEADTFRRSLAALAEDLTAFRIDHGNPTLEDIERCAPAGRMLSRSGVSDVFNGKRLPTIDFLIDLVRAVLKSEEERHRAVLNSEDERHRDIPRDDPRLQEWRSRWQELKKLQAAVRRSPKEPAGTPEALAGGRPGEPGHVLPQVLPQVLRMFVAMPGGTMGDNAVWHDIAEIREQLLAPVAARIGEQLACRVDLVIEKEKPIAGTIRRPMFAEAATADVYIADLTGANPNVYLELGARWALKNNVTILICQDTSDIRFNANDNRAIEYGWKPKELQDAINRITETALYGLRNPDHVDSPVREASDQILVSRAEYGALREDLEKLRHHQAEDLIDAALRSPDLRRRAEILEQATLRNPVSWRAYFELGATLRREGRYAEAEAAFRTVIALKDDHAPAWRELGMTLGKAGTADEDAVLAFDRALALDGRDAETWATQGGLFRRLARRRTPGSIDVATLERALACYERANDILPKNLYSLMNAARVTLLLAGLRGSDTAPSLAEIGTLELLARYNTASDQDGEPWARIDLAYALLLSGRASEGVSELRAAASAIAVEGRAAALAVEAEVLGDFLMVADALPPRTVAAIRSAVDLCGELSDSSR